MGHARQEDDVGAFAAIAHATRHGHDRPVDSSSRIWSHESAIPKGRSGYSDHCLRPTVQAKSAAARETTAAAANAAVNPERARMASLDPLAEIPILVKMAVPSAPPAWVAEPAIAYASSMRIYAREGGGPD